MKPINKDAKLLIRSYIDNIEDYLKTKSKMHPNIIDGILNEINDFVYIRSTELAKDKIVYGNVLKAIEECGSPSDICEQYLEDDVFDGRNIVSNKIVNDKVESSNKTDVLEKRRSSSPEGRSNTMNRQINYLDQLQLYPLFGLYRVVSVLCYSLLIYLATFSFIPSYSYSYVIHSLQGASYICINYTGIVLFWTTICFLLEGWLVSDWKSRKEVQGFIRSKDDRFVVIISRFSIILLLVKATLLPLPEYFFYIFPFLLVLFVWMERQQASNLWTTKIAASINKIASSIETGGIFGYLKESLNNSIRTINARSNLEKVFFVLSFFYIAFSLLFPWFYGWDPLTFPLEVFLEPVSSSFATDRLRFGMVINFFLPFVLIIGGIIVSNISLKADADDKTRLLLINVWAVRLVVVRTILMVTTYGYYYSDIRSISFLLLFLLMFEVTLNRNQNRVLIQSLVTGLKYLGSERKPYIPPETDFPLLVKQEPLNDGNQHVTTDQPRIISQNRQESMGVRSQAVYEEPMPIINYQSPIVKFVLFIFPAMGRFTKKVISLCLHTLYRILKPVYTFSKAVVIALILLIGSMLEVLLFIFAILTSLGVDGSYLIPTFTFDMNLHPYNESLYTFGGYLIWSWFILGILAAQIFFLVVVQWYEFARKRNDGVIIVFFRNFSRIMLIIVALGSISQGWWYYDAYAPLRIFVIIILAIFMEITTLKLRLERKSWSSTDVNHNSEEEIANKDVHLTTE